MSDLLVTPKKRKFIEGDSEEKIPGTPSPLLTKIETPNTLEGCSSSIFCKVLINYPDFDLSDIKSSNGNSKIASLKLTRVEFISRLVSSSEDEEVNQIVKKIIKDKDGIFFLNVLKVKNIFIDSPEFTIEQFSFINSSGNIDIIEKQINGVIMSCVVL